MNLRIRRRFCATTEGPMRTACSHCGAPLSQVPYFATCEASSPWSHSLLFASRTGTPMRSRNGRFILYWPSPIHRTSMSESVLDIPTAIEPKTMTSEASSKMRALSRPISVSLSIRRCFKYFLLGRTAPHFLIEDGPNLSYRAMGGPHFLVVDRSEITLNFFLEGLRILSYLMIPAKKMLKYLGE